MPCGCVVVEKEKNCSISGPYTVSKYSLEVVISVDFSEEKRFFESLDSSGKTDRLRKEASKGGKGRLFSAGSTLYSQRRSLGSVQLDAPGDCKSL